MVTKRWNLLYSIKIKISTHLKKTSNAYEITRIISFKKTKPAAKIQPAPLKRINSCFCYSTTKFCGRRILSTFYQYKNMENVSYYRSFRSKDLKKMLSVLKMSFILLFLTLFQAVATNSYSQSVTISVKTDQAPLTDLFAINRKTKRFLILLCGF